MAWNLSSSASPLLSVRALNALYPSAATLDRWFRIAIPGLVPVGLLLLIVLTRARSWVRERSGKLVLGLAALLRIAWSWWVPVRPVSDANMYLEYAARLAAGDGYTSRSGSPTAFWPVGLPDLRARFRMRG